VVDGYAENTLAAFGEAIRRGVPWVEVDVRRTGDDRLVVRHHPSLPDGRFLTDLTGAEAADAGVTLLDDLLEQLPDHVGVIFDVKTSLEDALRGPEWTTAGLLRPVLERMPPGRPLLVTSFDPAALLQVRGQVPAVALGLLTWLSFPLRKAVPAAAHLGVEVLSAHWRSFGPNDVDAAPHHRDAEYAVDVAHRAGLQVAAWSPPPEAAAELLDAGVDALIVDDVPGGLRLAGRYRGVPESGPVPGPAPGSGGPVDGSGEGFAGSGE
jgi:glycerophosphoryl diester phosphodiesterase